MNSFIGDNSIVRLFIALLIAGNAAWHAGAASERKPIYPEDGKGMERVEKAAVEAERDHKRVLLITGGNWCGWCHLLHEVLSENDTLRPLLDENYVVVMVESQADKDVLKNWQIVPRGVPYLTVLDPAGNKLVDQETGSLEEGPIHDPEKVAAFLEEWAPEPANAADVLNRALERAKAENKKVFVRVGAPWCGWCRRMDAYVTEPPIAAILEKDFVVTKLDAERMPDAETVIAGIRKSTEGGGIPWFAFLDGDGRILVTSTAPSAGNIGFPQEPTAEVPYFKSMLEQVRVNVTDEDVNRLIERLNEIREQRETGKTS